MEDPLRFDKFSQLISFSAVGCNIRGPLLPFFNSPSLDQLQLSNGTDGNLLLRELEAKKPKESIANTLKSHDHIVFRRPMASNLHREIWKTFLAVNLCCRKNIEQDMKF